MFSLFFSILLIFSAVYIGVNLNRDIIRTQEQMITNINKNIESFFTQAEDFSVSLVNSNSFKDLTTSTIPEQYRAGKNVSDHFNQLYLIAYKMVLKDYMIGVYTRTGDYIWMGSSYFINHLNKPEYLELLKSQEFGRPSIQVLEQNQMLVDCLAANPNCQQDVKKVISVCRPMGRNFPFIKDAMLDVEIPYENFSALMEQIIGDSRLKLSLYNKDGMLLYGNDGLSLDDYRVEGKVWPGDYQEKGRIVKVQELYYSNLYMVSSIGVGDLYGNLFVYIISAIAVVIFLNLLLLYITYRVSVRITSPLQKMSGEIEKIDLSPEEFKMYQPVNTSIRELESLSSTIVHMQEKLKSSMEEVICLRTFEAQSKMLALQAQMQPHFLYNTLMTIAAMAEEQENEEVARTCYSLTRMLRYISSDNVERVTLTDELNHLTDYINIMRERFPETEVVYQVPLSVMQIQVPKLVVQPLVENSLKYSERPDCHLRLEASQKGECWRLGVYDNGPGFSEERIKEIMERCERAFLNYRTDSLQINGMGLANIYIRLKLFYGDQMHFQIFNCPQQGCCVEIGGTIERDSDAEREGSQ